MNNIFREAGISIGLPSKGRWDDGNIKFGVNGTVTTYPLTSNDELYLKNADQLYSGDAIINLLKSCCPNVTDPSLLVLPDVHTLILAIRISSFGDEFDINAKCPECGEEGVYTININGLLSTIESIEDEDVEVRINDDTVVYLRSPTYSMSVENTLTLQKMQMEAIRISAEFEGITKDNVDLDMINMTKKASSDQMKSMLEFLSEKRALLIDYVIKDGQRYDSDEHKKQFVDSLTNDQTVLIDEKIAALNNKTYNRNLDITCQNTECGHQWIMDLEIDESNFFGQGF